jgi:hypothetical protein
MEPCQAALAAAIDENNTDSQNLAALAPPATAPAPDPNEANANQSQAHPAGQAPVRPRCPARKSVIYDREAVTHISMRHFGLEHPDTTARALGFTRTQMFTIRFRIDMPLDTDRTKFGPTYDPEIAEINFKRCGYELHQEPPHGLQPGRWFWRKKGSGQRLSRSTQKQRGLLGNDDRNYFKPRVELLTREDLNKPGQYTCHQNLGPSHEKLPRSRHAPPIGSGFSGGISQQMSCTDIRYGGNGGCGAYA